jgi:hypothetical protein
VCPVRREIFMEGTTPVQVDTYWQVFEVNRETGRLATASTPAEQVSQARYFIPPEEAKAWWSENNQPLPPTELDTIARNEALDTTRITEPLPFAYVGGTVEIRGIIDMDNVQYFQLSFGEGLSPSEWVELGGQQTTFNENVPLATWNTSRLDGLYSLRLSVVLQDNSIQRDVVQVTVDNVAPSVTLSTVEPGKLYRWPGDQVVVLEAQAQDNLAVDHVEFFHNGQFLGADETRPFGLEWPIQGLGTQNFSAVAFDTVGNQSNSVIDVQILRSGA